MIPLSANIYYTNFNRSSTIPSRQISTIVIGDSGMGKSNLINNLCGSKHRVGIDRKAITSEISSQTCKNIRQFHISDSPGIQSKNKNKNEILLEKIRSEVEWNTVFILTKLTARFGNQTLPNLNNIAKMLRNQDIQIVFLVSHLDILDGDRKKQDILQEFYNTLDQYKIEKKLILFSNINSDFYQLSNLMYEMCLSNQKARQPKESKIKIKKEIKQNCTIIKERERVDQQRPGCPCM